jgi:glycosyltransferase involved in cell wall biosynthesis
MAPGLRVAILGTRGIPARYGGFETFAEQLAIRLARRGHEVTVFGRLGTIDPALDGTLYRGVRLILVPAPRVKHLETVVHTLRAAWRARRERFDFALVCNSANFLALPLVGWAGARTALAIDGIESARRKWGVLGRSFHRLAARVGPLLADVVVADCRVIEQHYRARGVTRVAMIAYGAEPPRSRDTAALERLGVKPEAYVLYVSRLEPENNADVVIRAYRQAEVDADLVVVGDAPYAEAYKARLRALAAGEPRVRFAGYVFGEGYDQLRAHALCYVQATDVGGTHPALLEAMAAGLPVIANDIPEHREVLADAGWYYEKNSPGSLAACLRSVLGPDRGPQAGGGASRESLRRERGAAARRRAAEHYDWEEVTTAYEQLALGLTNPGAAVAAPRAADRRA